jgi:hypothetical protein
MPPGQPPAAIANRLLALASAREAAAEQRFRLAASPQVRNHPAANAVHVELVADRARGVTGRDPPLSIVSDQRDVVFDQLAFTGMGCLFLPHT